MARTSLSRAKRNPGERQFRSTLRPNQRNRPAHNAQLQTAEVDTAVLTLTFDRPVFVRGLTGITVDVVSADELSAVNTAPNVVEVTYDTSIAAATELTFPPYTANLRTADGGFAVIPTFPISA
jgi:hypothetical protein